MTKKAMLIVLLFCFACEPFEHFDVVIKNATVVDGSGSHSYTADIGIRADSIAKIGSISESAGDQFIDAQGLTISPGFIDMHAHGNPLKTPEFQNFLAMGVTTICLGQDGDSPVDLNRWYAEVDSIVPAVNIAMFSGHGTLRETSGIGYDTDVNADKLKDIGHLLEADLETGSFGLSFGLEYTPGIYAKQAELDYLAAIAGRHQALVTGHIRNEDDDQIEQSIDEMLSMNHFADVNISHFKVVYGKGKARAEELLAKLAGARQKEHQLTADVYPYTASYTGIGIVFPQWAKAPNDYEQVKKKRRRELLTFLKNKVTKRNGPEATLFGNGEWKGKTLKQVAEELNKPFEVVLADDIGVNGASAAYFVMNDELQDRLIQDSLVMISSDGSPTMFHPRGYGSFAKIIRRYVNEEKQLSLADAIRKMTLLPAQTIGLKKRGLIKEGYKADILIFKPENVRDLAVFDAPQQLADGFTTIIVNGKIVRKDNKFSDQRHGLALRKVNP